MQVQTLPGMAQHSSCNRSSRTNGSQMGLARMWGHLEEAVAVQEWLAAQQAGVCRVLRWAGSCRPVPASVQAKAVCQVGCICALYGCAQAHNHRQHLHSSAPALQASVCTCPARQQAPFCYDVQAAGGACQPCRCRYLVGQIVLRVNDQPRRGAQLLDVVRPLRQRPAQAVRHRLPVLAQLLADDIWHCLPLHGPDIWEESQVHFEGQIPGALQGCTRGAGTACACTACACTACASASHGKREALQRLTTDHTGRPCRKALAGRTGM